MTAAEVSFPDLPTRDPLWPDPLPAVLSPSSINKLLECPEKWRRSHLMGENERPSGALLIGGAESAAAERSFLQKIETHEDLPLGDWEFTAADAFDKRVTNEDPLWEDKPGESNPGEALDTTIRVVRAYHAAGAPLLQPATVEAEVELRVEGVVPPVRAYVDLTTVDGLVVSRKTSAKKVSAPKRGWLNQSAIESAATGLPSIYHVVTKAQTPAVLTPAVVPALVAHGDGLAGQRAARLVEMATTLAVALLTTYGPDSAWPTMGANHPFSPICGYCNFRPTCPAWL